MAPLFAACTRGFLSLALGGLLCREAAAQHPAGAETANRLLERSAARVSQRPELRGRVSADFDRDSLSIYTLRGLRRAEDSTVVGWFAGFSEAVNLIEGPECASIASAPPNPGGIVRFAALVDSARVDHWLNTWEDAATAAFVGLKRPPVSDSAMVMILFGMVAGLERQADSLAGPEHECRKLHLFLESVLALPWQERVTVFRGLSEQLSGSKKKH